MGNKLSVLLLVIGIICTALGCSSQESIEADLVIENVNVIPMSTEEILRDRVVVIKGDSIIRIEETGSSNQLAPDTEIIDGQGGYLIPGLAEMHAHIPSGSADRGYINDVLFLYLANGITTIRGMLGDSLHIELREQADSNELVSPRIYTSGPGFSGNSVESLEHARQRVREQHDIGYDFLKIFPGLSLEEYNAIAEEANSVGIEFSGHVPASVGLERALEAGQTTVDHLDKYIEALVPDTVDFQQMEDPGVIYFGMHLAPYADRDKISDVVRMTANNDAWAVPTQALLEHVLGPEAPDELAKRPEFQYMPDETVDEWIKSKQSITSHEAYSEALAEEYLQLRRDIIKALHEGDAGLLLGSDAPQIFNVPGFSMQHELRYMTEAGLSPYEAIRTGTYHVARYLDDPKNSGTVEEGKVADLVLLEANPLENISNTQAISGVVYRGIWLSKEEIEQRLNAISSKYE